MSETVPETVCGTLIERLAPADEPAFLISDLHVPEDGGAAFAGLRAALAAAQRHRVRLFVLGDLFDSFVSPAQVRVGIWRDVAAAFAEVTRAGIAIDVLVGNRDFLLGSEFVAASGVRLHHGGLRLRLGGVETLLLHGDELCQNDLPYQRAKRWLRSRPVRGLARWLPLRLALWSAARARRRSKKVIGTGDPGRFLPTPAALQAAFTGGVERLVFGHIHRHATARVGQGSAFVLPAFDDSAVGFRVDGAGLCSVRFDRGDAGYAVVRAPTQGITADELRGEPFPGRPGG